MNKHAMDCELMNVGGKVCTCGISGAAPTLDDPIGEPPCPQHDQWTFNDQEDGTWNDGGGCYADTPEEAFKDGCAYGYDPGTPIYVGKVKPLTWEHLVSTCDLRGRLEELVWDLTGEAGDDFLSTVSPIEWSDLERRIMDAISKWAAQQKPQITLPFMVEDVRKMGEVPDEQ